MDVYIVSAIVVLIYYLLIGIFLANRCYLQSKLNKKQKPTAKDYTGIILFWLFFMLEKIYDKRTKRPKP